MRIPTDAEGADEGYRERLMALLYTPTTTTTGLHSSDPNRSSPAPQTLEIASKTNYSNASLNAAGNGDESIAATTVGGGGSSGAKTSN